MDVIAALLAERTGHRIAEDRLWRIETALKPVLRDRGLGSIDMLAAELLAGVDPALSDQVVDVLLNHETSFFRDGTVLEQAIEAIDASRDARGGLRARIWCAGCSTGQEPLSLAMLLAERRVAEARPFPEIIATDVSAAAIARARAARYSQFEIQRGMPVRRMVAWFEADGEGAWVARRELVARIQYRGGNLVADAAPVGRFDLILCRNVLLYFDAAVRARVFATLAGALAPGGLLVLGAGETVIGQTDLLVPSREHRGFYVPRG